MTYYQHQKLLKQLSPSLHSMFGGKQAVIRWCPIWIPASLMLFALSLCLSLSLSLYISLSLGDTWLEFQHPWYILLSLQRPQALNQDQTIFWQILSNQFYQRHSTVLKKICTQLLWCLGGGGVMKNLFYLYCHWSCCRVL